MRIYLSELSDHETELDFDQSETWVVEAVQEIDEATESGASARAQAARAKERSVAVHFSLRKVDEVVVVSGKIDTQVQLLCSRCANPFQLPMDPAFSGLFCKDPVMAGVGHLEQEGKPGGQNKGFARHAHDEAGDKLMEEGKDLDITYLAHDYIDLKDVLTEQLQLQVPFQPLCKESCKGMCTQCGADLNVGRCACAKLAAVTPFSVLKDFKVSQG